jgi:hypothetical protein
MYLLGRGEVWPVYHMPWHIRCKYSCWDAPVVSRPFVYEDCVSQVLQSSGMCCHATGWAQASFVWKEHVCRICSPSDATSHHRRPESEILPPWKHQNSQIIGLLWCDTIVWQMDGTILILPMPNYMGVISWHLLLWEHQISVVHDRSPWLLYIFLCLVLGVRCGVYVYCVYVYCVYTNCSSTVDFAVLILNECTFLCDWCIVEVSSVAILAVSSLWLTWQVFAACCVSKVQWLHVNQTWQYG